MTAKLLKQLLGVETVNREKLDLLRRLHQSDEKNLQFALLTGSLDGVERICKQIVADFNTEVLEDERKLWNLMKKSTDE